MTDKWMDGCTKKNFDLAHPYHEGVGRIPSRGLGGGSMTDRQMEALTISPSLFLKKWGG